MSTITITPADTIDIPHIRSMARVIFYDTYRNILSSEQLDYMYDMMYSVDSLHQQIYNGHRFFIAYNEDKACGYLSIEKQGERLIHLHKLYIMPEMHGRQIGRQMIEFVFEQARALSPDRHCRVELNVNRYNTALDFYRHMGMHIASSGDFHIGNGFYMTDHIMAIDL